MGRRLRRLVVMTMAVLMIPVGTGRVQSALACSCIPNAGGEEGYTATADVVFDGIVTQQSPPPADPNEGSITFRFDVTNVVKGATTDPQDVTTAPGSHLCGVSFDTGRAYRVFARRGGTALSTGLCSGNYELAGYVPAGYRLAAADGGVFSFGSSTFHGSAGGLPLNAPVVGVAATPSNRGYWLAAADGGVFAYGDARFLGSLGGRRLNAPVVGITPSPTGQGYWLAAADGGVFAYGDARFLGSTAGVPLNAPVVGITATGTGAGYWMVGADGGVFGHGDARYHGREVYDPVPPYPIPIPVSAANVTGPPPRQTQLATGITAAHSGAGYWISSYYGTLAGFGDVGTLAPHQSFNLYATMGVARTGTTLGLAVANDWGEVVTFDAAPSGDLRAVPLTAPVVAISG